mmetsp:Transcript_31170/g.73615  ORF Transcript_31170/g.73615 Transcript_31170/m.73615 type:complete len:209 (-) Transcript_31170:19-645(-)
MPRLHELRQAVRAHCVLDAGGELWVVPGALGGDDLLVHGVEHAQEEVDRHRPVGQEREELCEHVRPCVRVVRAHHAHHELRELVLDERRLVRLHRTLGLHPRDEAGPELCLLWLGQADVSFAAALGDEGDEGLQAPELDLRHVARNERLEAKPPAFSGRLQRIQRRVRLSPLRWIGSRVECEQDRALKLLKTRHAAGSRAPGRGRRAR